MHTIFSYGSNLSRAERERVGLPSGPQSPALLRGFRFEFSKESRSKEGGSRANIVPETGRVAIGGILEVSDADLDELRRKEGGYEERKIEVELVDGGHRLQARTFVASAARYRPNLLPPEDYVTKVLDGIRELGAVGGAAELASRQAALPPPPTAMPAHGLEPERHWRDLLTLDSFLVRLRKGAVPGEGYDGPALRRFLESAVKGQRESLDRYPDGSFALIGHDGFEGDIRFDLILRATAVVVAILSLAQTRQAQIAASVPGIRDAVRRGLDFLAQTSLAGAGYDATAGAVILVHTLADGELPERLAREPDLSPSLLRRLRALRHDFAGMLPTAPPRPAWGTLARWEVEEALGRLRLGIDA